MSRIVAGIRRGHGGAAFHVRNAAVLSDGDRDASKSRYFCPSMTTAANRSGREIRRSPPAFDGAFRRIDCIHPLARPGHHHGRRQAGARRDRRIRSHDGSAGRLVVGALPPPPGARVSARSDRNPGIDGRPALTESATKDIHQVAKSGFLNPQCREPDRPQQRNAFK